MQYREGIQYRGGYHDACGGYLEYRGGCSVPWRDIMSTVGVILSTVGILTTVGMHMGDIVSTVGRRVFSTVGDTTLCNLSTVGGYQDTCGEYHEYRGGCSVPRGYSNNKRFSPTVLMISPTVVSIPTVLKITTTVLHTCYTE